MISEAMASIVLPSVSTVTWAVFSYVAERCCISVFMRVRRSASASIGLRAASPARCSTRVSTEALRYTHKVFSLTIRAQASVITAPPPNAKTMSLLVCLSDSGWHGEGLETVLPLWPQREGPIAECDGRDCFQTLSMPPSFKTAFNASSSICRNAASPSVAKISGMLLPSRSSITSSRSIKEQQSSSESRLPTLLLPHPINPVNEIIILSDCHVVLRTPRNDVSKSPGLK